MLLGLDSTALDSTRRSMLQGLESIKLKSTRQSVLLRLDSTVFTLAAYHISDHPKHFILALHEMTAPMHTHNLLSV
jgi:hypothetical protein